MVSTSTPRNDRAASPRRLAASAACSGVAPTTTRPTRWSGAPPWMPSSARCLSRRYAPVTAASSDPVRKTISLPAASTSAGAVSAGMQTSQRRMVVAARGSQRVTAAGPAGGTWRPSARKSSRVTSSRSKRTSAVGPPVLATSSASWVVQRPAITGTLPTRTVVTAPRLGPSFADGWGDGAPPAGPEVKSAAKLPNASPFELIGPPRCLRSRAARKAKGLPGTHKDHLQGAPRASG